MIDVETSEKVVLILYVILSVACSVAALGLSPSIDSGELAEASGRRLPRPTLE